ncbi:cobalt-precorrin-6A reductase [Stenomitos frigidus ULC18]|uniref:Cobalt-precorrin-6A reductase n=1 Tax=Stenomitos frigidus ULC18 TaxID=2107698 RepID=A0A2T1DSH3_9CYAN|nr:cobalt-precorrin-6A reductase [Stenomitos frigidus ULC18]
MSETTRILILGGTGDAAALAAQVSLLSDVEVMTSLAGRTQQPSELSGSVRVGGFGGSEGLVRYLKEQRINVLIDATHPFAAQISWNAASAVVEANIPHLMLVRPAWKKVTDDRWLEVESVEAAAQAIPSNAQRIFLTIGRQQLAPFTLLTEHWFLMRSIDPPAPDIALPNGELLLDRGPFTVENEIALLKQHAIEAIVSKNSGGDATYAKIAAARELELPVVMVQRPTRPSGERVKDVASAVAWLKQRL